MKKSSRRAYSLLPVMFGAICTLAASSISTVANASEKKAVPVVKSEIPAKSKSKKPKVAPAPLKPRETYDDIIKSYSFVADFAMKEPTRQVSDELFWKYPLEISKVEFPIYTELTDLDRELPATIGSGRAIQHLNRGRAFFLEKDSKEIDLKKREEKLKEARTTWLSARHRFAKTYPFHRRNDYFIGSGFLTHAGLLMKEKKLGFEDLEVKSHFNNTATFYSWAFIVKKDEPDELVEAASPKGLYNLAAIYFRYGRVVGAYGAAEEGMNFLRKTGRKEYRTQFRRIIGESHLATHSYLEALQEFDAALRQDRDKHQAGAIFARVGDLYFGLNNYELAEDAYRIGGLIDEEQKNVSAAQMALRGEALFWMGKYADAQRLFHYALNGIPFRKEAAQLSVTNASWAKLRFADAWMAQKKFEEATLAYFQVEHDFRGTEAARIAAVRRSCLEMPFYLGRNVEHARNLLSGFKGDSPGKVDPENFVPDEVTELAWACFTSSYSERERTRDMVERVRAFSDKYPESRFLKSMAEPVRVVQASLIDGYFEKGSTYAALSFFEKNRKNLFKKVPEELAQKLFTSYVKVFQPAKAAEFWSQFEKSKGSDLKVIQQAVVAAEMTDQAKKGASIWKNRSDSLVNKLLSRSWSLAPDAEVLDYIVRLRATAEGQAKHLPWIFNLSAYWGQTNAALACELEYPLLVQIADRSPKAFSAEVFAKHITSLVQRTLPGSLETDESCAASVLDLEAGLMKGSASQIAATYLQRRDWPMKQAFVNQLWLASEKLYEAGDHKNAKELWVTIESKAPKDMPEVVFAKTRLDPKRTEFENMWN